jgi:hypothetical protein
VSRRWRIYAPVRRGRFFDPPTNLLQIVTVVGIDSAESFGTPLINDGIVRPTGIPSAESFGTPTMVPGAVTIDLAANGIPSAEFFGIPSIIIKFDLSKLIRIERVTVGYELICVARIPQPSGVPTFVQVGSILWDGLNYTEALSSIPTLQASTQVSTLSAEVIQRLANLRQLPCELWLYREGEIIFSGPLTVWNTQSETLTMQAMGAIGYMNYWTVDSDQVFSNVDQFTIVKTLIDLWQNSTYGNFGLVTSNIGTSGITRDATYLKTENNNIGQRIFELGQRDHGFNISVDPTTRQVQLWYPQQGIDRSDGEDSVTFDQLSITSNDVAASVAPGDVASDVLGITTGTSDPLWATVFNPDIRAQFGRTSVTGSFDGVTDAGTLNDHLQGLLNARNDTLLVPGPKLRVAPETALGKYGIGDTVVYRLHVRLGVEGTYRIRKRSVSVERNGVEEVTLEFV